MPITLEVQKVLEGGVLYVYGIHFFSPQDGLVLGGVRWRGDQELNGNLVLLTEDGGQTWQPILTESGGSRLFMLSRTEGWMWASWVSRLSYTADGGRSWIELGIKGILDVYFTPEGQGWAITGVFYPVNPHPILYSLDKGVTWNPCRLLDNLGRPFSLIALTFGPGLQGWAVGEYLGSGGVILMTEDGQNWKLEESPTKSALVDVQSVEGIVYAVGRDGIVLKRESSVVEVHPRGKLSTTWGRLKKY